jgi:hypothetical protein
MQMQAGKMSAPPERTRPSPLAKQSMKVSARGADPIKLIVSWCRLERARRYFAQGI